MAFLASIGSLSKGYGLQGQGHSRSLRKGRSSNWYTSRSGGRGAARVDAGRAGAERGDDEHAAGHGEVLHEHQLLRHVLHLGRIPEGVKNEAREKREHAEREG